MVVASFERKEFRDYVGDFLYQVINEDKSTGWMTVRGVFQKSDVKNGNNRIYPRSLWKRILGSPDIQERLESRQMLGEVEHPTDGMTNLSRVSHIVTKLFESPQNGNDILGEAMILKTPNGNIIQELFRAGVKVGISSRGTGTSYKKGDVEIVNEGDYELITFDFVWKPSTPGAYPKVVESLRKSPFGTEGNMADRKVELSRIEVRCNDIKKGLDSADVDALQKFKTELEESYSNVMSLGALVQDDPELKDRVSQLTEEVKSLSSECKKGLDHKYFETRSTLTPSATSGCQVVDSTNNPESITYTTTAATGPVVSLEEHQEVLKRLDYFMDRCKELSEQVGSVSEEEYSASVSLVDSLVEKCEEKDAELERLGTRLKAATSLIEEIVKRNDRAQVVKTIREAIESNNTLLDIKDELMACESLDDVHKLIKVAIKINEQDDELPGDDSDDDEMEPENDTDEQNDELPGDDSDDDEMEPEDDDAEEEDVDQDEDDEDIPESMKSPATDIDLPEKGAKLKSDIFEKSATGKRKLNENTGNSSVDAVNRLISKRNWK